MATSRNCSSEFDRLPDEIVEYIFLLITYSPSTESVNPTRVTLSPFYFPYNIHEPELRRTFKDLLSLQKVCRRFHKLLHSPTFWIQKCRRDHWPVFNQPLAISQGIDFRRLFFSNPFHPNYNLLELTDPNGQFWTESVSYQTIPSGSDLLYDEFGRVSPCHATSYNWGHYRRDNIRLLRKGQENVSLTE